MCASRGGDEGRAVAAFGLSEGTPNVHPGQGTACRRFFFRAEQSVHAYLKEKNIPHIWHVDNRPDAPNNHPAGASGMGAVTGSFRLSL